MSAVGLGYIVFALSTEKPLVKKPAEAVQRPKPPADGGVGAVRQEERNQPEPPQIKGPVEPERKKEEEVQLDRPEAGKKPWRTLLKPGAEPSILENRGYNRVQFGIH